MTNDKTVEAVARAIWEAEYGFRPEEQWAFLWGNDYFREGAVKRAQAAIKAHLCALADQGYVIKKVYQHYDEGDGRSVTQYEDGSWE